MTDAAIRALLAELDRARGYHGIATPDSGLPPSAWPQSTLLAATLWIYADGGLEEMLRRGCIVRNRVDAQHKPWRDVILGLPCWRHGNALGIQATYPLRNGAGERWERAARCAYLVRHRRCPDVAEGSVVWPGDAP